PDCVEYKWEKRGSGDVLMLALPLHLQLLSKEDGNVAVLEDFKYKSIDGDLVGVVGDSWTLKSDKLPVTSTWDSINKHASDEIKSALSNDVAAGLESLEITTNDSELGKIDQIGVPEAITNEESEAAKIRKPPTRIRKPVAEKIDQVGPATTVPESIEAEAVTNEEPKAANQKAFNKNQKASLLDEGLC
ncbi:hypothetical protein PIB30_055654, partial [Stylosanthes scabra]|nr:hypothetical protein [Stylosanthes scabra]